MKTIKYAFLVAGLASLSLTSCNKDTDVPIQTIPENFGIFVLNQGSGSNSSLGYFQFSSENYFSSINNGQPVLGGTGVDLLRYGSKLYVSVDDGSVKVINANTGTTLQSIAVSDPRYLTSYRGKVYVSHGENSVSAIDTVSLSVTGTLEVGNTPEQLTAFRNRLYVANSGAKAAAAGGEYENHISVVNTSNFTFDRDIDIPNAVNLHALAADSVSNTLFVNANATYTGDTRNTASKLYTVNVDNGNINSNIAFGTEHIEIVYTTGTSIAFATSSNRSGVEGQHEILYLQNLPAFTTINTFFSNTSEIEKPVSLKFIPEFGYVTIGDERESGSGRAYLYTVDLNYGASRYSQFDGGTNPIGFAAKY